jgi:sulfite exporter TauE/SafE/copper chaperone CopZ
VAKLHDAAGAPGPPLTRLTVPIAGMTCRACEARVAKILVKLPGVADARVSLTRGTAQLLTSRPVPSERIDSALASAGYHVGASVLPWISRDARVWRDVVIAAAVVAVVVVGASALGLGRLTERLGGGVGAPSLAVVLGVGIVASLSTCMALVGGLVLSLSARFASAHPDVSAGRRLRPQAMFNLGRVVGFAALGAGLGALGGVVGVSGTTVAVLTFAAAAVMAVIGVRLTGVSPRAARVSLTVPSRWTRWTDRAEARPTYRDATAVAFGAASFFLPCGFTQAVQVYALSTGSAVQAALVMGVFAVGTAPGLFGVGAVGALASGRAAPHVFRAAGVAVLAFALVNVIGAIRILDPTGGSPSSGPPVATRSDNVVDDGVTQVLSTVQSGGGYEPAAAAVYADRPVRWEIESKGLSCASSMDLEAMGLGIVDLTPGLNVVEFTPSEPGTLVYTCRMGMFQATIEVIPPPPDESPGTTASLSAPTG